MNKHHMLAGSPLRLGIALGLSLVVIFSSISPMDTARAQGGAEACPALIDTALTLVAEVCAAPGRDTACYGHTLVDAELWSPDPDLHFNRPADTLPLMMVRSLHTAPVNPAHDQWGLAVLNLRADVPDVLPGQAVTFLLMGDATLESAVMPDDAGDIPPMQAVYFTTGLGEPTCHQAPDALLVQNTTELAVTLTVNDLNITLASSVLVTLAPDEGRVLMLVTLLEGTATLRYAGFATVLSRPGDALALPLDEAGRVAPEAQPVELPAEAPAAAAITASCETLATHPLPGSHLNPEDCTTPPRFVVPPFEYYEIGGFGTRCPDMEQIVPDQLLGFQKGIGRWPTVAEMQGALAGMSASIAIDGEPLVIYYEGPTWHTGGPPPGYGDRGRANWRATPGEHTVSGGWSGDAVYSCTFTVD